MLSKPILLDAYTRMQRIRQFEMVVHEYSKEKKLVMGIMHSHAGAEGYATGVMLNLREDDYIATTYRCHAHAIARNIHLGKMAAEFCGKVDGVCKGMAGNMHCIDQDLNIIAGFGIIGAGLPAVCGTAFAAKYKGTDQVSCAFFGDGSIPQGAFHESMNMAKVQNLPVLFINDNNRYAMSTVSSNNLVDTCTLTYAQAYKMPAVSVDGMNFFEVYQGVHKAVESIRQGNGPYYIECNNYRYHGQFEGDAQHYKITGEDAYYWTKDPVAHFERTVTQMGLLTPAEMDEIKEAVRVEVEEAFVYADHSPYPPLEAIYENVYADPYKVGEKV